MQISQYEINSIDIICENKLWVIDGYNGHITSSFYREINKRKYINIEAVLNNIYKTQNSIFSNYLRKY